MYGRRGHNTPVLEVSVGMGSAIRYWNGFTGFGAKNNAEPVVGCPRSTNPFTTPGISDWVLGIVIKRPGGTGTGTR